MYYDVPLWLSLVFVVGGFLALAWSSDLFVDGAAVVARSLGISPFIIGMVIIGFGTSAPELCVSLMSGLSGHANVSLGNAYGSCIFNIAAILGVSALIRPLTVSRSVVTTSVPILSAITLLSFALLRGGSCTRASAFVLLAAFAGVMTFSCWSERRKGGGAAAASGSVARQATVWAALKLVVGLAVLIGASHVLVWGAVDLARAAGVSELMIGLTIVAVGTSLPELASAVASARRGEHAFVMGNIIGSNIFNMLAVVGLATAISPIGGFSPYILTRDLPVTLGLTLSIALFGFNWRRPRADGVVNRLEGLFWISLMIAYTVVVLCQER